MVKFSIDITLSKILAYLVLIIGSVYSFYFNDATILIATFSAASAIIAVKTYTSSVERQKQTEENDV